MSTATYSALNSVDIESADRDLQQKKNYHGNYGTLAITAFVVCIGLSSVYLSFSHEYEILYGICGSAFFTLSAHTFAAFICPSIYDNYYLTKLVLSVSVLICGVQYLEYFPINYYIQIAKIGGILYIALQQLFLLDFSYSWNYNWVNRSGVTSRIISGALMGTDLEYILTSPWLIALCVFSLFYGSCFVAAMVFYSQYFNAFNAECSENGSIIIFTSGLMMVALLCQLCGSNGSILTSGIISLYAAFITYNSLILNPNTTCNPSITSSMSLRYHHVLAISINIVLTYSSILWMCIITNRRMINQVNDSNMIGNTLLTVATGEGYTPKPSICQMLFDYAKYCCCCACKSDDASTTERISNSGKEHQAKTSNAHGAMQIDMQSQEITHDNDRGGIVRNDENEDYNQSLTSTRVPLMNMGMIYILAILYMSMILTNWGQEQKYPMNEVDEEAIDEQEMDSTSAGTDANMSMENPQLGYQSMWMQICGLWMCLGCYILSLVMPSFRCFPRSIWDLQPRI